MAKKSLTIDLKMNWLFYEVKNKTYLTGRSRMQGDNHEQVANMQSSDDEEDQSQIMRSISSAVAYLHTRLSEYISNTIGEMPLTDNDILKLYTDNGSFTLTLNNIPANFNTAVKESITASAHNYIVNRAVGEWFQITNKADAQDYFQAAAINLAEIREAINKRVRPQRPVIDNNNVI